MGGTCVGTAPSSLGAGATALSFTGVTIPASSSCTVTFSVTSSTGGSNPNTTSGVTTTQTPAAGTASNTATLTVTGGKFLRSRFADIYGEQYVDRTGGMHIGDLGSRMEREVGERAHSRRAAAGAAVATQHQRLRQAQGTSYTVAVGTGGGGGNSLCNRLERAGTRTCRYPGIDQVRGYGGAGGSGGNGGRAVLGRRRRRRRECRERWRRGRRRGNIRRKRDKRVQQRCRGQCWRRCWWNRIVAVSGTAGTAPGGGGGGGAVTRGVSGAGGAGGNGQVKITWSGTSGSVSPAGDADVAGERGDQPIDDAHAELVGIERRHGVRSVPGEQQSAGVVCAEPFGHQLRGDARR